MSRRRICRLPVCAKRSCGDSVRRGLVLLFGSLWGVAAFAGEFPVSGSHKFLRETGKSSSYAISFSAPVAGDYYLLRIYNGEGASFPVTSGTVSLNGVEKLSPNDFKKREEFFELPVTLGLNNTLSVKLAGKPGSGLRAEVIGIDNQKPAISAVIDPEANLAGWHKSDATVTFTCSDELAGIESCSAPVLVTADGANQAVVGTAVDRAGNSASTQVEVSLDKTPPAISTAIAPPANEAGWHKSDVTLTFTCSDNLSGVADCPAPETIQTEGADQRIAASVRDIAGNSFDSETVLQIDKGAPTISVQLSSAPNAAGWHSAPVTISYSCQDSLSGIASCPPAQTVSGDLEGEIYTGHVEDIAGNGAEASITINLDQTAPEITFFSPSDNALLQDRQPALKLILADNLSLDNNSLQVSADGIGTASCTVTDNLASCVLPAPLPNDREIALTAQIKDLAGNRGDTTIEVAIDSDSDNIADYRDQCADTPAAQTANSDGCALTQLDSDSDGINDAEEIAAGSDPNDNTSFPPVVVETFVASPSNIETRGQKVELRWQVKGALEITLTNDADDMAEEGLPSEGVFAVNPQITTRYTLTANGPAGDTSQSLSVNLDLPPPPELWTNPSIPVDEQIATSLSVADDGNAYLGAFDGNFYKVNPRGEVEWTLENAGLIMGKAAIDGNRIIFGANVSGSGQMENAGRVYALAADKTLLWGFDTQGAVVAGPIFNADKSIAYIATYTGNIYALNAQSGEQLWYYQIPDDGKITATPALSQQKLIVHTEDKKIFALDASIQPAGERILWIRSLE